MNSTCRRGHEFTPENTVQMVDGRRCRTCRREADARRPKVPQAKIPGTDTIHVLTPEQIERFWSKVDRRSPDDCWEWTAYRNWQGYGKWRERRGSHHWTASRLVLSLTLGRDLGDMCALHTCDNPPCCNPAHLVEGTVADNSDDMKRKGRAAVGERVPTSKLTSDQVLEIRRRLAMGRVNISALGREYGVSDNCISCIRDGKTWAWLTSEQVAA